MTAEQIVKRVNFISHTIPVTFSGGNPAIWDLTEVIKMLKQTKREVWVETQGTYWRDWLELCDVVVVSPKGPFMDDQRHGITPLLMLKPFAERTNAHFKVVIGSEEDLDYAELIAREYRDIPMYLSVGCPLVGGDTSTEALLGRYKYLAAALTRIPLRWPRLVLRAAFIPQLHVLVHGSSGRRI
jgi:7-carboxy-7-deazaguanine synthase